jgi:acetyl esterase
VSGDVTAIDPENVLEAGLVPYVRQARALVAASGGGGDVATRRRLLVARARAFPPAVAYGLVTEDDHVVLPGREIPVRVFRPSMAADVARPAVLYCHGGGFIAGDLETHAYVCALLAMRIDAVVLGVHYRRAPENPYPAALEDCDAALAWLVAEAERVGADPRRIALAGDSAGGALAASLAIRCRDRGGPSLRAQALLYPVLDDDDGRPSYLRGADPFLTRDAMRGFLSAYLPERRMRASPEAIPMRVEDPRGLPPTYILAAELDPLRDEAHAYAAKLAASGVAIKLGEWPGTIHGFLRAQDTSAASRAALDDVAAFLRAALLPSGDGEAT